MIRTQRLQCQDLGLTPGQLTKSLEVMQHSIGFFFYFWLCWLFLAACGLFSSCRESGVYSLVMLFRLLIAVASLVADHGLQSPVVAAPRL